MGVGLPAMTRVTCLDGEHSLPLSVQLSLSEGADRAATILALSHCPACPDVHLMSAGFADMQVCPCCWTVWWTDGDKVRCTHGAVETVDDSGAAPVRRANVSVVVTRPAA
jgi:hypothetical protein